MAAGQTPACCDAATHSDLAGFSEKTLRTKSASLCGSKVEGTMMYSPAGSRSRELTSLRLMKSSERALEAWVRKKSRLRWTPDLPTIWDGRTSARPCHLQSLQTGCFAGFFSICINNFSKNYEQLPKNVAVKESKKNIPHAAPVKDKETTSGEELSHRTWNKGRLVKFNKTKNNN